jgi:hypothetical protein
MKMKLVVAATACALAAPAFAQSPEARQEHRILLNHHELLAEVASSKASAETWRQWGDDLRASLGTMFGDSFAAAKPVKGAPYSADVVTEVNQTLADGNIIARKTTGRIYRDGEGRTRQETVVNGETKSIQLRDPVEGSAVMLLPGSKTAVRMPTFAMHKDGKELKILRFGDREIRVEDGKVSVDGKPVNGKVEIKAGGKEIVVENGKVTIDGKEMTQADGAKRVIVKRHGEGEDGVQREEVRVHVMRSGSGKEVDVSMPAMAHMPLLGGAHGSLDGALLHAKSTTTALGTKEFEGIRAEGKSSVRTIPAGEIGNRNPIMVTSETWRSPELQVTVYSRQNDPRYGETIYRLTNIRRAEPAAELFKVPEDYKASGRSAKG